MIDKVLIVEDHESVNLSIQHTLDELSIKDTEHHYYCDEALIRLQKRKAASDPFDLLITDIYFDEDYHVQKIKDGIALIIAARNIQPELKVLVLSAEGRRAIIDNLFSEHAIDGYVRKSRNDARQLKQAIQKIAVGERFMPHQQMGWTTHQNAYEFTPHDIKIIALLAQGVLQKNIPDHLAKSDIKPLKLSSVEKRLNRMKEVLEFSKNEQLVAFCKDMGII